MSGPNHRLASLDFLRGIAALSVAIPHFFVFAQIQAEIFEAVSVIGVEVFFVLSGFVLAPQILAFAIEKPSLPNLGIFLVRRWMRTIPAYFLALLLLSVTAHQVFSADFLRYAVYVQNLTHQSNVDDYFSIAWSLSVEEWFYLVFPPVMFGAAALFGRTHRSAVIGALLFIGTITLVRTAFGDYAQWGPQVRRVVVFRVDSIAWGFLLYLALQADWWLRRIPAAVIACALAAVSLSGFVLTLAIERGGMDWAKHAFPLVAAIIGALGIMLAIELSKAFERSAPLTAIGLYLGRISYSIYLFHLLVLMTLSGRLAALPWLIQALAFIATTTVVATLVYETIEAPILRSRPKFRDV